MAHYYYYYVNKNSQDNGEHEVHKASCNFLPSEENRLYLGYFTNCHDALREAKEHYSQSDGCKFCSLECHTS